MDRLFAGVKQFLGWLGLTCSAAKSQAMVFHADAVQKITVGGVDLPAQDSMRFLGVKVTRQGVFLPWKEGFNEQIRGLWARVCNVGLGSQPRAFLRAL